MIYTVTLNPALDKTAQIPEFTLDSVNRISELRVDPGGKGINVSKVIAKLGGESIALAVLGGGTGKAITDALAKQAIECRAFEVEGETRTNLKVIDPKLGTHTDINEPGPEVTDAMLDSMLEELVGLLQEGDIVVLSGSLPRGAAANTYEAWVAACKKAGTKVFLDADGDKLVAGLKAHPYLTKPNEIELGAMLGRKLDTDELVAEAGRELVEQGVDHVVVSMGGAGRDVRDQGAGHQGKPREGQGGKHRGRGRLGRRRAWRSPRTRAFPSRTPCASRWPRARRTSWSPARRPPSAP
jgi:1-phosphofructokinase